MTDRSPQRSRLPRFAGPLLILLLAAFAALHAYWALGGAWGLTTALGGADVPRPAASAIWTMTAVLLAFALCAAEAARRARRGERAPIAVRLLLQLLVLGALLFGGLNLLAGTTPIERFGIAPFALLLALLAGILLWTRPPISPHIDP